MAKQDVRREFRVQKDTGDWWLMQYTSTGVQWERDLTRPDSSGAERAPRPGPAFPGIGGASGTLQAIAEVGHAAAAIGMTWEARQTRLRIEADREELRRIPWLTEMIGRWGEAHQSGDVLNLRVSEYLAREAQATMESLVPKKGAAIPQSILYELDMIIDAFRSFRYLLRHQFEAATSIEDIALGDAIRIVLPDRKLDMEFIRQLARDPAVEWAEHVLAKKIKDFDTDWPEVFRHSDLFMRRLFPSTALGVHEPEAPGKAPNIVENLIDLMTQALPRIRLKDLKPDADKQDMFRELMLLPAEVSRVKALHAAWLATDAIYTEARGASLSVGLRPSGIALEAATQPYLPEIADPTSELAEI